MTDNASIADDVAAIGRIDAVQKILDVVCRITGMGFSAVARVTGDRWVACAVRDQIAFGLKPGGELALQSTICNDIRHTRQMVAIDHVADDPLFREHPTPKQYGFQSYISVPITLPNGDFFGTLCAIDPKPALVSKSETVEMFRLFAELIAQHLETERRMHASEAALIGERETAQFREQFMAVLGHDLRNPLAAISSGADVLRIIMPDGDGVEVVKIIQRSAARMAGLIDDTLDFARGRLGGGISVRPVADADLGGVLRQVVGELQTSAPGRRLDTDIRLTRPVVCDAARLGQMLSNLVANALTHGDPTAPVCVRANTEGDVLDLSVSNCGTAIPPHIVGHLFKPFARGSARPGQQGLGLGLYIASEIAKAHGGTLGVTSSDEETRFTFRMPIGRATAAAGTVVQVSENATLQPS